MSFPIALAVQLGLKAMNTIASFTSNPGVQAANSAVQDAAKVVQAVAPLVEQYAAGNEVTEDDVRQSFARTGASFDELDALIAEKKKQQG